jgi:hypothetical protein
VAASDVTAGGAMPGETLLKRAVRLTYAQVMLGSVFGASTGGMFLIGFAMAMGANDVVLGLLGTAPMLMVAFQFMGAWLVERGTSRKKLAVAFGFVGPAAWFLIVSVPLLGDSTGRAGRLGILFGIICLVTVSLQLANNARSSWLGELIPADRRGSFFGYCTMFGGIVGAVFAVAEGRFLDYVAAHGLFAFTALFLVGALFGLASAAMMLPQPDCPLPGGGAPTGFFEHVRSAWRNEKLRRLAGVNAVMALGSVSLPFVPAYLLRDVGLSYFGLGLVNSVWIATWLASSPFWGKMADRFGCRPVLTLGLCMIAPCAGVWLLIPPGAAHRAYTLLPLVNLVSGAGNAAIVVALSAMLYKVSRPEGRSVQFAAYSVLVTYAGMPMPVFGGWLVSHLKAAGYPVDLRLTFFMWALFIATAAALSWRLKEPRSARVRTLVFGYFPGQMVRFWGAVTTIPPFLASILRLQLPGGRDQKRPE